jgi:hypothetical protein
MTVQEGIDKAKGYLQAVLPEYSDLGWQLEEVETAANQEAWSFTFTTTSSRKNSAELTFEDFLRPFRVTKLVEVDAKTGDLLAVRNKVA